MKYDDNINQKSRIVDKLTDKLKRISRRAIKRGNIDRSCAAISAGADLLYRWNQSYTDSEYEGLISDISNLLIANYQVELDGYEGHKNTVLFYDGFGLDLRGWARNYLTGLKNNGYKIVYVTKNNNAPKNAEPEIYQILSGADSEIILFNSNDSYIKWIDAICKSFIIFQPENAFFYTTPYDVAGCVAFEVMHDKCCRYQIDLTDHAFWLGVRAVDYSIEVREIGVSNACYYRGFKYDQLRFLDSYVTVERNIKFRGFPFDSRDKKILFSGGAIYKTLGDPQNTFYNIVDELVRRHNDLIFYYLGSGDTAELSKLKARYPEQIFYEPERDDYFQIIERCTLYLNTYPFSGGIMVRCAALLNKIPLTLKHGNDNEGFLIDQEKRQIEYDNPEELICDAEKLLYNEKYREERENKLRGSVISEEEFTKGLKLIIEEESLGNRIISLKTTKSEDQKADYRRRFCLADIDDSICKPINKSLFFELPVFFGRGIVRKTFRKIKYKCEKEKK